MTTTLYKLTNANRMTYGGFPWSRNRRRIVQPEDRGTDLCTHRVIHAYRGLELALLLDDAHARYLSFPVGLVWRAATDGGVVADDGTKVGVWDLTLLETIPIPGWRDEPPIVARAMARLTLLALGSVLSSLDRLTDQWAVVRDVYQAGEDLVNARRPEGQMSNLRRARMNMAYDKGTHWVNTPENRVSNAAYDVASTLIAHAWHGGVDSDITSDAALAITACFMARPSLDAAALAAQAVRETLEREQAVAAS